jgi:hypothetical protein
MENELITLEEERGLTDKTDGRLVDWEGLFDHLRKGQEVYKKIRIVAVKFTREEDWVNMDGKPYLTESGCQAIAGPLGVSFSEPVMEKRWEEDGHGRYYVWTARAKVFSRMWNREMGVIGICSSRDNFFGRESGGFKPVEDVDERNVQFKALTNMWANGVKRILGLRNFTWEELKAAGLRIEKIAKVEHRIKGRKTGKAEEAIRDADAGDGSNGGEQGALTRKEDGIRGIKEMASRMVEEMLGCKTMNELATVWAEQGAKRLTVKRADPGLYEELIRTKDKQKEFLTKNENNGEE